MYRFRWILIMVALLAVQGSLSAQADCGAMDIARQMDALYNDYLTARSLDDDAVALEALSEFKFALDELLTACGGVPGENDPSQAGRARGTGTSDDPYGFGQAGEAANGVIISTVDFIRPAEDVVQLEAPDDASEWVIAVAEVECPLTSRAECEVNHFNFRLMGDSGTEYEAQATGTFDEPLDVRMPPGRSRTGGLAFTIPRSEANLKLVYYPESIVGSAEQTLTYYRAQPSIEVTATARIIIRGGPGTQYGPLDALEEDQRASAIGRNEAGTWVRIEEGWVAAEFVTTASGDINHLPVIEAED